MLNAVVDLFGCAWNSVHDFEKILTTKKPRNHSAPVAAWLSTLTCPSPIALLIRINLCSRYVLLEMGRKDLVERVRESEHRRIWDGREGGRLLWHSNTASPFLLTLLLLSASGEQSPRGTRRRHARVSQDLRRAKVSSLWNSQSRERKEDEMRLNLGISP